MRATSETQTMVIDYGQERATFLVMGKKPVETIAISDFKATCLAVLERVRRTGASIIVTRRGEPIAEIVPPSPASTGNDWLGSMRGTAQITGDIVSPASTSDEWEAFRS